MALFKIQDRKVLRITPKEVDKERKVQNIFEDNLEEILNITFLSSEYSTSFGGRIDTLGIDKNGSPVIIEYKKGQNDSIINQGLSYLRWLLDHKANFETLCRNKGMNFVIDWDTPRVICISESYNKFDLDTVEILPIHVELLKYQLYDDNLLSVEAETDQKVKISVTGIIRKNGAGKNERHQLQKIYSLEDHLQKASQETKSLFSQLREKITALDEDIKEEPKKYYIAYKLATNFVDIEIHKNMLKIFLNLKSGQLYDPKKFARDLTKPKPVGHWANGDYEIRLESPEYLEETINLVRQSYILNK